MNRSVTGCIVTYNNIRTIGNALESLFENIKGDFHLFVVDNGSTDGTVEFIKENYPQVELIISEGNCGFGKGHNKVLPFLNSDYHVIINPDIIIKDDVVSKMADYLDKNEQIGMLSPEIRFPDGRLQVLGKKIPHLPYLVASRLRSGDDPGRLLTKYAMLDRDLTVPFPVQNATGCFMFIRTALFKEIGGFDKLYFMYFEDGDLTREVNRISSVWYYPDCTIYHEWGRESKKNTKLMIIQIESMFKYYAKWAFKKG